MGQSDSTKHQSRLKASFNMQTKHVLDRDAGIEIFEIYTFYFILQWKSAFFIEL